MIVEDKILEYLDGSLGEHERAELLETLATSPEKRALLEEHLRLKDILALGRKPYNVPLATERALAERLPILSRPGIAPVPVGFRAALLGVRQWVGSRAVQTAMGVAAILAISAVAWFGMRPAASQVPVGGQQSFSSNSSSSNEAKDIRDGRDANDGHTSTTNSAISNSSVTHSSKNHSGTTRSSAIASTTITPSVTTQSAATTSSTVASAAAPSAIHDEQDIHSVTNFSQNDVVIPHQIGASTLSEIESGDIQSRNPVTIGVHYQADKSYLPQSAAIAAQSPVNGEYAFTLDYDISDNFAIGAEAGREIYALLVQQGNNPIKGAAYSRIIYTTGIAATQTNYFCLTTHYTFAPESGYPFRVGLEGGVASTGQPTALATAGFSRVLSENLLFDLDAIFGGVWGMTSPSAQSLTISGGVEGIVRQDVPQQKTFTSGAGIRAGIRFRL